MKLTALLAQERREGIEQGREEGVNIFYSFLLPDAKKKNPHKLLISEQLAGIFAIIPIQ